MRHMLKELRPGCSTSDSPQITSGTTRWPTLSFVAPSPTLSTTPVPSKPGTAGRDAGAKPGYTPIREKTSAGLTGACVEIKR